MSFKYLICSSFDKEKRIYWDLRLLSFCLVLETLMFYHIWVFNSLAFQLVGIIC